jgi:hypothetical protein
MLVVDIVVELEGRTLAFLKLCVLKSTPKDHQEA